MKTVGEYFHLHECYIDKSLLDENGIESHVQNETLFTVTADGYKPNVQLKVHESDFEKAYAILIKSREEE